jgi:hypothetical protein
MTYRLREIAGWLLTLAGLFAFYESYDMLMRKRVLEAVPMAFIGFIVFRGGIHMLKVSVAAFAARNLRDGGSAPAVKRARAAARPIGPTPAKNVLPGPQNPRRREEPARSGK